MTVLITIIAELMTIMCSYWCPFCFQIVNLIEETGHFHITNTTFDFDLCSLDKTTVRKLQSYLETSGTSWKRVQLAAMSRNTRPPDCPPDFVSINLWQCYGISFIKSSWCSFFSLCASETDVRFFLSTRTSPEKPWKVQHCQKGNNKFMRQITMCILLRCTNDVWFCSLWWMHVSTLPYTIVYLLSMIFKCGVRVSLCVRECGVCVWMCVRANDIKLVQALGHSHVIGVLRWWSVGFSHSI